MKKQLWVIALITALAMFCVGCQSQPQSVEAELPPQSSSVAREEKLPPKPPEVLPDPDIQQKGAIDPYLENFEEALKKGGLTLENQAPKDATAIGALEGYGFLIRGLPLEIYLFDMQSSDEKATENLKTAKESGYITIFGTEINGKTPQTNCTLHKSLTLIFPSEDFGMTHPDKEAIIKAFRSIS